MDPIVTASEANQVSGNPFAAPEPRIEGNTTALPHEVVTGSALVR